MEMGIVGVFYSWSGIIGVVQKVLKVILTPQHKALIRVIDTICCGVKNPKQAFWTAPCLFYCLSSIPNSRQPDWGTDIFTTFLASECNFCKLTISLSSSSVLVFSLALRDSCSLSRTLTKSRVFSCWQQNLCQALF